MVVNFFLFSFRKNAIWSKFQAELRLHFFALPSLLLSIGGENENWEKIWNGMKKMSTIGEKGKKEWEKIGRDYTTRAMSRLFGIDVFLPVHSESWMVKASMVTVRCLVWICENTFPPELYLQQRNKTNMKVTETTHPVNFLFCSLFILAFQKFLAFWEQHDIALMDVTLGVDLWSPDGFLIIFENIRSDLLDQSTYKEWLHYGDSDRNKRGNWFVTRFAIESSLDSPLNHH